MSECIFCVDLDAEYRSDLSTHVCDHCYETLENMDLVETGPGEKHPLQSGRLSFSGPMLDIDRMDEDDAVNYKGALSDLFTFVNIQTEIAKKYNDVETRGESK